MPTSLAARLRRALPRVRWTRRRAIASAVVVVLVLGLVGWAVVAGPGQLPHDGPDDHRPDRPERHHADHAGHPAVPAEVGRRRQAGPGGPARARLRRHQGQRRARTRRTSPTAATRCWPGRPRASAAPAGRSTWTARTGRSRTPNGCSTGWPPGRRSAGTAPATLGWLRSAARTAGRSRCMLAGVDQRVDAIVPMITWNDLARSFLPEATGQSPVDAASSRSAWAGMFFGSGDTVEAGRKDPHGAGRLRRHGHDPCCRPVRCRSAGVPAIAPTAGRRRRSCASPARPA